jgi:hypothetical protein
MYEIIKVGIPLQTKDITNEFLNVIHDIKNNSNCIAITTVDYSDHEINIAPAGNYMILDNLQFKPYTNNFQLNCINTMGFLWGTIRDIPNLVNSLITILDTEYLRLKFKKVYILAGGSPLCGDSITLCLSKIRNDLKIIDTNSCINTAYSSLNLKTPWVEHNYVNNCIRKQELLVLDTTKINIFLCLQSTYEYNNIHILNKFFEDIKQYYNENDIIKLVNIKSDTCETISLTVAAAEFIKEQLYNDIKPLVFVLYKKELE